MSLSDIIRARYAAVYASPTTTPNAPLVSNLFPSVVQLREGIVAYVSSTSLAAIDAAVLALTDALVAASTQDVVETALENLRVAISAGLPTTQRELVDPTLIGATVVVAGVSVGFTAISPTPAAGSRPYEKRAFGSLRSQIRLAVFAIDDKAGTQSFAQAM
jgi:hypothetical protein